MGSGRVLLIICLADVACFGLFDDGLEAFEGFFDPGLNFRGYFGHGCCRWVNRDT